MTGERQLKLFTWRVISTCTQVRLFRLLSLCLCASVVNPTAVPRVKPPDSVL